MKFMKPSDFIFSAIIFCSIFIRKSISVWSLFRLETNLNNLLFNHGLLVQLNGSTVSECSLKCLMMDNCASFQIQDDLELCRLYWTYFLLPSTGTPSTGWKTYYSSGSCKKGHLYARQYGYCLHYVGQLTAIQGTDVCRDNSEELIKVDSREENVFVSELAYSFVNNTEGQGSNKLIIDGVFSNGAWVSLFGDRSSLIYTNFFKDEALGSENDRVNIRPSSSTHIAEYDWTSQPGLHNTRTILCRYYPKKFQIGKPQKKTVAIEYQCS
uniref:Uncharacterized protein n=1 Tax=Magallana gigas TaxID=29159 RepID=A0A8W8MS88_MAGGI|nr:uncharacterized protein LOC105317451 [Crassostrea gigas]